MTRGAIISSVLVLISLVITAATLAFAFEIPYELASPYDRIKENQIHVYKDKIVIDIEGASWATYADTNSMDPLFDYGANGLELIPRNENEIHIGDIAAYESKITGELIVHRVVNIKEDSRGKYFIFKGDNNKTADPEKVRFQQIKYVLIGIIY